MGTPSHKQPHRDLRVLDSLWDHFGDGLAPSEIAKMARLHPSGVTRALQSLRDAGYAEQIPETGRWRISHRVAGKALGIARSLERAKQRLAESANRIGVELS